MKYSRLIKMAVATSAIALALAACGSSGSSSTEAGAAPGGQHMPDRSVLVRANSASWPGRVMPRTDQPIRPWIG